MRFSLLLTVVDTHLNCSGCLPAERNQVWLRCGLCGDDAGTTTAAVLAALQCATLIFAHATPDAGILAGLKCPLQAHGGNGAAVADNLGLGNLGQSRAGVTDREEQLGVFVTAD